MSALIPSIEALVRGDGEGIITPETLEEITKKERGSQAYSLALLRLKGQIESAGDLAQHPVTVRREQDSLRIMRGVEAASYHERRFFGSLRLAEHHCCRHASADMTGTSNTEQSSHRQQFERMNRITAAFQRQLIVERKGLSLPLWPEKEEAREEDEPEAPRPLPDYPDDFHHRVDGALEQARLDRLEAIRGIWPETPNETRD